jgi:hypothetical protein
VLVLSGKLAVNATANKTSHSPRNPQLEWLKNDIALSKFITCSRTLSENLRRELTRKHYAPESGLSALKRQFAGCFFVFPYDQLDPAKLLLRTQTSTYKFLLNAVEPVAHGFVNSRDDFLRDHTYQISLR